MISDICSIWFLWHVWWTVQCLLCLNSFPRIQGWGILGGSNSVNYSYICLFDLLVCYATGYWLVLFLVRYYAWSWSDASLVIDRTTNTTLGLCLFLSLDHLLDTTLGLGPCWHYWFWFLFGFGLPSSSSIFLTCYDYFLCFASTQSLGQVPRLELGF
jgi:hypothetical protein